MKTLGLLIKDFIKRNMRRIYWLIRLMQAKKGSNFQIQFPVKVEGKGKLSFGNNCKLSKNTYFACGKSSNISFGNNCRIDDGVQIIAGENAEILFADNCWIMSGSIIRTSNKFEFDNNVKIAQNCAIFSRENGYEGSLQVGQGTHIGDNTIIDTTDNVTIENEVAIGANSVIYTHDHNYMDKSTAAWKGRIIANPVKISKGAWIASGVTILPKVEIAEACVIAAAAVVTKSTKSNSVYGGVPAKFIKSYNQSKS